MTMRNVRHGQVFSGAKSERMGILSAVTNVFWQDEGGVFDDDAALLLMRRSFGVGKTSIALMRKDAYLMLEPNSLIEVAQLSANTLFSGAASQADVFAIADMIVARLDDLIMHPPESQVDVQQRKRREFEKLGALVRVNGQTLVDAR